MRIKLLLRPPPALAVLVVLISLGVFLSREASITEDLPVFLPAGQSFVYVELAGVGIAPGVYQFYDGLTPRNVIKLTAPWLTESLTKDLTWSCPLRVGESLRFVKKDRQIEILHQGWMSASQRLAMAIPLHPDRMSVQDWTVLPGIGPALADQIENDRQKNGDYGTLNALMRVKGIGTKRVASWTGFFDDA